ncbi:hypothetical protein BBF96_08150 [Anoxybacter fermentans]|uniref:N-acetyltransferase domain-containing protein n=1 Tax=Anoxybacter fermentans TaxID=1323375 RepID=A0A3S9SYC1_9FIRM|nr:GNAT family N-acetyltransferase [Anoxybacter fermentans]AZR73356.1 hypothetical protein BBF96_08150 [Anoxybacter fermentans]
MFIEAQRKNETSLFLVARVDGKIVDSLGFQGNLRKHIRHSASFKISVLKDYWGLGIGTFLLNMQRKLE